MIPALTLRSFESGGGATPNTGAQWLYTVPRYYSDQTKFGELPHSWIEYVSLNGMMYLEDQERTYFPEIVAGIIDPVHGGWDSVGTYNGTQGEFAGWSGNFAYPNYGDTDGKIFSFGLITLENEAWSHFREAVSAEAVVELRDEDTPSFSALSGPGGWWNTGEPAVTYSAEDDGLGVAGFKVGLEGQGSTVAYTMGCSGTNQSPCPRTAKSTETGRPVLKLNAQTAPEGIDHYNVSVEDPLYGFESGGTDPTPHASTQSVPLRVDHSPPTVSLSGSATEEATIGTEKPQYTLKYIATDGAREPAKLQKEVETVVPAAGGTAAVDFRAPAGIAAASDDSVWLADSGNNQIVHLTRYGAPIAVYKAVESETLKGPKGIATAANGNVWVADTGNNRLVEFNSNGEYIRKVSSGSIAISDPQGVAVAPNGNVWFANTGYNVIDELTSTGAFVGSFEAAASPQGGFRAPQGVSIAPNGNVWVADTGNNRVVELSAEGSYLASFGSAGSGPLQFNKPNAIDVDSKGNVEVVDEGNGRVQQLSERGEFLGEFGEAGSTGGRTYFGSSAGIATLSTGEIWVTNGSANRLQEWNPPFGTRSGVRSVAVKVDGKVLERSEVTCPQGGCPLAGEVTIQAGEYAAGPHTIEVTATDGVSLSKTETRSLTLNQPPPAVTLSGTLTEQGSLGTALPHYTLIVNASAQEGSGVAQSGRSTVTTEVTIDGKRVVSGEASCTTETCPISREWMLNSGEYAPGEHRVVVTATDRYGRKTTKELKITLNPPAPTVSLSGTMTEQATLGTSLPRYVLKIGASAQEGTGSTPTPTYSQELGGEGSGPGRLSEPTATATDAEGDVWVADAGHHRVQEFNPRGEFIRQFGGTGTGTGQFGAMHGIAVGASGNVYVGDASRVQEFNPKGEYLRQWGGAGTGNGQFESLTGLTVDPEGHVWTVESYGGTKEQPRLQEFSAEGAFLKVIEVPRGTEPGQLKAPGGLAVDATGDLWVADTSNSRIEEFNAKGEYLRKAGGEGSEAGQLSKPAGIVVDAAGDVWVADTGNNRVEEFGPGATYLSQFGGTGDNGGQFSGPKGLAIDTKGDVWIADTGNDRIEEVAAGEYVRQAGGEGSGPGRLSEPTATATDAEGDVWVADAGHHRVQEFNPRGEFIRQFGGTGTGTGQFGAMHGIAVGASGNVYVGDASRVQEFNPKGEYLRQWGGAGTGNGQFESLTGLTVDPEGHVWTVESYGGTKEQPRLQEFSAEGAFLKVIEVPRGTEPGQLKAPGGLAVDATGDLWVADTSNSRIEEFNAKGEYLRKAGGEGSEAGQLSKPAGIVVDAAGDVWVADTGNNRVEEFGPGATYLSQFGGTGDNGGQFSGPKGLALAGEVGVWVTDAGNNRIQRWNAPATRSTVRTEVTLDGKVVDEGTASCATETCPITREWILPASAELIGSQHTVVVKATDGYGYWTSKTRTIEINPDKKKPTLEVSGELKEAPEGWVGQESYGLDAVASDPTGYGVSSIEFKIDGTTVVSRSQQCPDGACAESLDTEVNMAPYAGGSHEAEVAATDAAGNVERKKWTINVDPEGHVTNAEATATLEAAEETGMPPAIGEYGEEEPIDGAVEGLGLETTESGFQAVGSSAPTSYSGEPDGPMTVQLPTEQEIFGCESAAEEDESDCVIEPAEVSGAGQPIKVTPVDTEGQGGGKYLLVEESAAIAANSQPGVDQIVRPLDDGGMIFTAIREGSAPQQYSYEVDLGEEQFIEPIDPQHVEVYYSGHHPAFGITAEPAHDAVGTTVPTTISVTGRNIVTLTIHLDQHPEGQSFVYPVVGGTGWEGGFTTISVEMTNPFGEPEPSGEGCVEDGEECEAETANGEMNIVTVGPPVGDPERRFKFTHCKPHHIPHSAGITEVAPINVGGEDEKYQNYPEVVSECNNPEFHGIYWAVSAHGHFR